MFLIVFFALVRVKWLYSKMHDRMCVRWTSKTRRRSWTSCFNSAKRFRIEGWRLINYSKTVRNWASIPWHQITSRSNSNSINSFYPKTSSTLSFASTALASRASPPPPSLTTTTSWPKVCIYFSFTHIYKCIIVLSFKLIRACMCDAGLMFVSSSIRGRVRADNHSIVLGNQGEVSHIGSLFQILR